MARKIQKSKSKSSNVKPSTSVKKGEKKRKSEGNLSNGYGDNENAKETKNDEKSTAAEVPESSEIMDNTHETPENVDTKTNKSKLVLAKEESVEMEDVSIKAVTVASKPRKRKIEVQVKEKKEGLAKTKTKRQKILLEIPKRSTVPGKLFVIGENDVGQLGLGEDITDKPRPALLDLPHSIVEVAAGGMHSVCLTESGEVITFGCNDEGALGRITSEEGSEFIPQRIDIPERIVQVTAGDSHSAALSETGQVYTWGNFRNNNGPMGLITDGIKQCTPVKILNDITVVKIASGSDHLVCLSQEGVVYTCGCGDAGQLGRVSEHASIDGGRRGKVLLLKPDKVPVSRSSKSCTVNNIWTGSYATFLNVKETGLIYGFGLNNYCQLGLENENTIWKPKQLISFNNNTWLNIDGGQHHTLTLDDNGLVYSLGRSEYGRLGLGENCDMKSVPTVIPSLEDRKCTEISSGNCVSFAVTEDGSVYSWGMGTNNQLGHGDDSDQHLPQLIEGKFFNSWEAFKISGGGQHTLILAHPRKCLKKDQ